jgi:uncharacterized protein
MDVLAEFIIPIVGLKLGEHTFQFEVDGKFFEKFDNTELEKGNLHIDLCLVKRSNLIELNFQVQGSVQVICDRCADDLNLALRHKEMRIVKFSQEEFDPTDDVMVLGPDDHELDVSHMVYETIALAIPFRRVHSVDSCNQEVLDKLEEYQENEKGIDVDERWSALKKLLTDKE